MGYIHIYELDLGFWSGVTEKKKQSGTGYVVGPPHRRSGLSGNKDGTGGKADASRFKTKETGFEKEVYRKNRKPMCYLCRYAHRWDTRTKSTS